jgi:hypothetical protein
MDDLETGNIGSTFFCRDEDRFRLVFSEKSSSAFRFCATGMASTLVFFLISTDVLVVVLRGGDRRRWISLGSSSCFVVRS